MGGSKRFIEVFCLLPPHCPLSKKGHDQRRGLLRPSCGVEDPRSGCGFCGAPYAQHGDNGHASVAASALLRQTEYPRGLMSTVFLKVPALIYHDINPATAFDMQLFNPDAWQPEDLSPCPDLSNGRAGEASSDASGPIDETGASASSVAGSICSVAACSVAASAHTATSTAADGTAADGTLADGTVADGTAADGGDDASVSAPGGAALGGAGSEGAGLGNAAPGSNEIVFTVGMHQFIDVMCMAQYNVRDLLLEVYHAVKANGDVCTLSCVGNRLSLKARSYLFITESKLQIVLQLYQHFFVLHMEDNGIIVQIQRGMTDQILRTIAPSQLTRKAGHRHTSHPVLSPHGASPHGASPHGASPGGMSHASRGSMSHAYSLNGGMPYPGPPTYGAYPSQSSYPGQSPFSPYSTPYSGQSPPYPPYSGQSSPYLPYSGQSNYSGQSGYSGQSSYPGHVLHMGYGGGGIAPGLVPGMTKNRRGKQDQKQKGNYEQRGKRKKTTNRNSPMLSYESKRVDLEDLGPRDRTPTNSASYRHEATPSTSTSNHQLPSLLAHPKPFNCSFFGEPEGSASVSLQRYQSSVAASNSLLDNELGGLLTEIIRGTSCTEDTSTNWFALSMLHHPQSLSVLVYCA
ncbi:hypothetical protein GNI_026550 [Gregarina niphandrodes]|uniref:Uncharacterized protein n=1 Tax=Gregarina niphandrodes TaxID=110365 RepID=A0A023BBA2_GRENI|nr:hypothetical protein GNI_026550 [Gregarina niphandrodes]EZG79404.1 hypothetical protein GNI_026550 [Gregarina niphandrodes]|eukprot:XP_011129051.1 hypothetical protein GNI_026550 [Gregarina niphandrodes]